MELCKFLCRKYLFLLLLQLSQCTNEHFQLGNFLRNLFNEDYFADCTLQLFSYRNNLAKWTDRIGFLVASSSLNSKSNGLTISEIDADLEYYFKSKKFQQPKIISHSKRCSVVLLVMNMEKMETETIAMKSALTLPLLSPPTIRNRDKFLIITEGKNLTTLSSSEMANSLKFKLFLVLSKKYKMCKGQVNSHNSFDIPVSIFQPCQYGLCKRPHLLAVNFTMSLKVDYLFPDLERNFFGHPLRLSTTTNVPQLLEMEVIADKNCKKIYIPKRGVYATVLAELSARLNFTYEIVPSSGNGSTGHTLPNGTWVGIVGDTHRGEVDFGFMAAITYHRYPFAEFCAPINYAYLGFVTGPPMKTYRWNAILWPFNPSIWLCLGLTIIITAKIYSMISHYSSTITASSPASATRTFKIKSWNLKEMTFLVRALLEQCEDLAAKLSHSFKLFVGLWLLFSLVMTAAYKSKMVSLLTFPIYDRVPTTFDELATATEFKVDFHYFGNVGYNYFKHSTNPSFMKIYDRMWREPNPLKCMQRTLHEKRACITFIATFQELLHRNLSDQYGKSPLKFTPHLGVMFLAGVIHQYQAPLSINFKRILFPAMETGLIPNWDREDLTQVLQNKNKWQRANNIDINTLIWGNEMDDNLLRVRNLHGAFAIFVIGMTAAFLSYFVEKYRKRFRYWWLALVLKMGDLFSLISDH